MRFFLVVSVLAGCAVRICFSCGTFTSTSKTFLDAGEGTWENQFQDYIRSRLSPPNVNLLAYEGGGLPVLRDPHTFDCSFKVGTKCCWHNIGGSADEFDFALFKETLSGPVVEREFGVSTIPVPPAILTGSPRTADPYQALLVSCPILCQNNTGSLTLTHWLTPDVKLDVCRMEVGQRQFLDPCSTLTGSRTTTVDIPPLNRPFYMVIVASGFTHAVTNAAGGGVAIVDDIVYHGASFCPDAAQQPRSSIAVGEPHPGAPDPVYADY